MTTLTLYTATDQLIELSNVVDETGQFVVGATITGKIVDKTDGSEVTNGSLTFADVSRKSGSYTAVLTYQFAPQTISARGYTLQLTGVYNGTHFYCEVACNLVVNTL